MLVIHIGPRKTATTYLQSNFYRNRKELLEKGWLYPVVSQRAQNAHHGVVSSRDDVLSENGALFKRLKRAADQASRANANLLISSEGFRKWKAKDFVKLGKVLDQDDVLIVYTCEIRFLCCSRSGAKRSRTGAARRFPAMWSAISPIPWARMLSMR